MLTVATPPQFRAMTQCGHVVAVVRIFLTARWSLAHGGYEEELPRCIADLAAMPEAGALHGPGQHAKAKTLLPQMNERIHGQPAKDRTVGEVDPKRIIADWCAKQTEKTALCEEEHKMIDSNAPTSLDSGRCIDAHETSRSGANACMV